jgi:uncharacterized membrane protein YdjX (TVP38/TMEM64 family)
MPKAALLRWTVIALLVAALLLAPYFLPINDYLRDFLTWAQGLGVWGLVLLAAFYTPACLLMIPGSLVTLAGGALFDFVPGTVAVSLGSTVGACAAFLVGRGVARGWVERQVSANPRFRAIDHAIGAQGFRIVLLLRLSPVFPFNLLNYALSLTRVRFRDYALASWVGMLPGTMFYVYLGSKLETLAQLFTRRREPSELVLDGIGLAFAVVATVYITRVAKRALDRAIAEANKSPAGESHAPDSADPARRPA